MSEVTTSTTKAPHVNRSEILSRANDIVTGERQESYGTPEDNFGAIAQMWSVYLGYKISSVDVAAMMACLKICRIKTGHGKLDNWVDLAGYAACGGEIEARMVNAK